LNKNTNINIHTIFYFVQAKKSIFLTMYIATI
jgi:hypothetical protein